MMLINPYQFGSQLWTPSQITTALWLDAADTSTVTTVSGAVSQWNDKSGNGRNFSQSSASLRPTYTANGQNGKNVITHSTTGLLLSYTGGGLLANVSGGFISLAAACTSTVNLEKVFIQVQSEGANSRLVLSKDAQNRARTGGRRQTANSFVGISGTSDIGTSGNVLVSNVDYAGATLTLLVNGTQEAQTTSFQTSGSTPNDGGNAAVGNTTAADAPSFTGSIFEIIVGHSALSVNTRQRIEGYLAHKWGLTANLPSNHPYKTNPPGI